MKSKIFVLLLVAGFALVAVMEGLPHRAVEWIKSDKQLSGLLSKIEFPQSLPGPLLGPLGADTSELTTSGVVQETNKQRELYGLPPLRMNQKLNLAAKAKLDDMFRQQYFEHESPDGKSPADVIKATGYQFIVVGENLALGNYKNDAVLVEAWMNSPGHRANILDVKFYEIGVAVAKGSFQGNEVWMAVQEFGSPLSNCPSPEPTLQGKISANKSMMERMQNQLNEQKVILDSIDRKKTSEYNQAVAEYNRIAKELNNLIDSTKGLVEQYNSAVNEFNRCLERHV